MAFSAGGCLRHFSILKSTATSIESKKTICICYSNITRILWSRYYYSASIFLSPRGARTSDSDRKYVQNEDKFQDPLRDSCQDLDGNTQSTPVANICPDNAEHVGLTDQYETERFLRNEKHKAEYITEESRPVSIKQSSVTVPQIWSQLAHKHGIPENIAQLWNDKYTLLPSRCGGCGAPVQFKNPEHIGFVPVAKLETLASVKIDNIKKLICQNCFYLKHYNQLLVPTMNKDIILDQFKHLPRTKSLIIYIVDMLDIEGTMFPDLLNLVGESKRILIVGNKIDMLSYGDSTGKQQHHMKKVLREICLRNGLKNGNIKDICLVSGKTGYGIEEFLLSVIKHRDLTMDICLVGCTNVGKSTIFNLLQNMLSVHRKDSTPPQSTVHHLPGTTFGMLRYPISYWNLQKLRGMLSERTDEDSEKQVEEYGFDDEILRDLIPKERYRGDASYKLIKYMSNELVESKADTVLPTKIIPSQVEIIEQDSQRKQCWLYDTPGLINDGQIIQFLKPKEIKFLQQNLWIVPRTLILKPGMSLLFGGLARLDFNGISRISKDNQNVEEVLTASQSVFFTVFCPKMLPLHVTSIKRADDVYERHFGKELLQVPSGGSVRKEEFPPLEPKEHEIFGIGWDESAADLVLAGTGWIAITAGIQSRVQVSLHTPQGLGQYFRETPLMPFSVAQRGKRGVWYQGSCNNTMYEGTRRRSPQLVSFMKKQNENALQLMKKVKEKVKAERIVFIEEKMKRNLLEGGQRKGRFQRLGLIKEIGHEQQQQVTNLPLYENAK